MSLGAVFRAVDPHLNQSLDLPAVSRSPENTLGLRIGLSITSEPLDGTVTARADCQSGHNPRLLQRTWSKQSGDRVVSDGWVSSYTNV